MVGKWDGGGRGYEIRSEGEKLFFHEGEKRWGKEEVCIGEGQGLLYEPLGSLPTPLPPAHLPFCTPVQCVAAAYPYHRTCPPPRKKGGKEMRRDEKEKKDGRRWCEVS